MTKKLVLILLTVLSLSICFMLVGCEEKVCPHNHKFADEWVFDATSHWHDSVCDHNAEADKEDHTLIDGICYVCGYNARTSSTGEEDFGGGLRCEDYNGDPNYKSLTGAAAIITDLKVYTKDRKPIVEVQKEAFQNNKKIKKVTLGSSVLLVGQQAFLGCTALEEVVIENCAVVIQANAFKDCTNLKKITFGDSVIGIGEDAFVGCTNLSEVVINNVNSWCNIMFINANSNPLTFAKNITFNDDKSGNLVIKDGLKKIGSYAFNNCLNLNSIEIPDSIVSIGDDAFAGCENLKKVNYIGDIGKWCETFMYSRYSNPLNYSHELRINGNVITEVNVPDGVVSICNYAFVSCDNIKKVSLPSSILLIGDGILFDAAPETIIFKGSDEDWECVCRGINNSSWLSLVQFAK